MQQDHTGETQILEEINAHRDNFQTGMAAPSCGRTNGEDTQYSATQETSRTVRRQKKLPKKMFLRFRPSLMKMFAAAIYKVLNDDNMEKTSIIQISTGPPLRQRERKCTC